ncbi:MAG: hypothetical protein LBS56_04590 [Propionibacteriaceae bacterium]|jgi:hypothetical protein|nr:hypothetical protein [Propionibacteriaceae bacterium]
MIGRQRERDILLRCLESDKSEFVAVYGRRRVGKTFLVKEVLGGRFTFHATGVLDAEGGMAAQVGSFNDEIAAQGGADLPRAATWRQAFANLNELVGRAPRGKKVLFLDELPWMATRNSDFVAALDWFWNRWAASREDVLLVICGSATQWIIEHIVDHRGGLHNRLTRQISLQPFTLRECEEFFRHEGFVLTRHQMAEAHMVFGGVPYYLSLMDRRFELYYNIDELFFAPAAPLRHELDNLFRSLFAHPDGHVQVVRALAAKARGLSRDEIAQAAKLPDGGGLTRILRELEQCGFIRVYLAYGKAKRDKSYQLADAFTRFAIRFGRSRQTYADDWWRQFSGTPAHSTWAGHAFEQVCLAHVPQIKAALGVAGVLVEAYSWRSRAHEPGAQIDLVLDRADRVVNLCEIKYAPGEHTLTRQESLKLRNRLTAFTAETKTTKAVRTTMITTFGLKPNKYAAEILSQITLDALFA